MKLTGKLKEQVEKAETKEEKKRLIKDAGMELTDEELDMVAGGGSVTHFRKKAVKGETKFHLYPEKLSVILHVKNVEVL